MYRPSSRMVSPFSFPLEGPGEGDAKSLLWMFVKDFAFSELEKAYDTFKAAEDHGALKVLINIDR